MSGQGLFLRHLPLAAVLLATSGVSHRVSADEYGDLPKSWQAPPTAQDRQQEAPDKPITDFRKIMREAAPLSAAEAADSPPPPATDAAPIQTGDPMSATEAARDTRAEPGGAPVATDDSAGAAQAPSRIEPAARPLQRGLAAWYQHEGVTASGEVYKPDGLTAAHRTLPLGARLRIRFEKTGKEVTVRVNDRVSRKALQRRPLAIELSRASAEAIGLKGVGEVAIYSAN